jgi:RNA polymerase sigma-70 factor (ECF subfamily)
MQSPENGGENEAEKEAQLVVRVHASARAIAKRLVKGRQRADDIAQDVALDFLRRIRAGAELRPGRLDAYVATIVMRRRNDTRLRRRRAEVRDWTFLSEISASRRAWMNPEVQWEARELEALYRRTLDSLPPRCRQAFVAVREDGQSYAEAARSLGCSVKMIAKHVTRAQRVFRVVLRERGIRVPREKRRTGSCNALSRPVAYSERKAAIGLAGVEGREMTFA